MKKKSVFRKIAFLLTIALIANIGVFDLFSIKTKAADRIALTDQAGDFLIPSGSSYQVSSDVTMVIYI